MNWKNIVKIFTDWKNIFKMIILPKSKYRLDAIFMKMTMIFSHN